MSNKWTNEQQNAIDLRNCSILVSAAAGSGKTAVLVERIIKKVTDENNPINIDQMVIVTFTKAAAGEMKDRIRAAIEKEAAKNPENIHLQKQKTLVHHANITTIDSFCSMIIKSHFDKIDMDPSSRIAENGEIKLILAETMEEVMEEYYRKEAEGELNGEFIELLEKVSPGKEDSKLEELILKLYNFSMSYASPESWLDSLEKAYKCETVDELEKEYWMPDLRMDYDVLVEQLAEYSDSAIEITDSSGGPYMYKPNFEEYTALVSKLKQCRKYSEAYDVLNDFSAKALSRKKDDNVDGDLRELAKSLNDECKSIIGMLKDNYYFQSPEKMQEDLFMMHDNIVVLTNVVKDFIACFSRKKREKNVHDFSDLEHMALRILVDDNGNPTEAAKEYAEYFDEIMIDEYQDSNFVQEALLSSVSKRYKGQENVFMVGDAKQSIYKFRLARPEIFTDKYENYSVYDATNVNDNTINVNVANAGDNTINADTVTNNDNSIIVDTANDNDNTIKADTVNDNDNSIIADTENVNGKIKTATDKVRIDLFKNFRSRREVLYSVNYIFERIMKKSLGGIDYDDNAALHPGASFPEKEKTETDNTELLLIDGSQLEDIDKQEFEAELIAHRIKQLVSDVAPYMVTDSRTDEMRPCMYSDIAILLRSNTGMANTCIKVFEKENIPLVVPNKKGYFEAEEIDVILNLLQIIDNPMQDIPFVSVLKSPIVSLSEEELSIIKIEGNNKCFYEDVCSYIVSHIDESENVLSEKLTAFSDKLDLFREKVNIMPLHEFLWLVLDETGYGDYICAMPNGEQRNANMQMLIRKAIDFETTSYIGVFQFVKYIEQIKSYDDDEGQAVLVNENENAVRLMTIHKSKGLEFPVVFVANLGGRMNFRDENSFIILHPQLGLGIKTIDLKTRHMRNSLLRNVLKRKLHMESVAEEMRVLYVAMTRAKEKLILCGNVNNLENSLKKAEISNNCENIGPFVLSQQNCYMDWILAALKYHPSMKHIFEAYNKNIPSYFSNSKWDCDFDISVINAEDLIEEKILGEIIGQEKNFEFEAGVKASQNNKINEIFSFKYQEGTDTNIPIKVSVSDIKKAFMDSEEAVQLDISAGAGKGSKKTAHANINESAEAEIAHVNINESTEAEIAHANINESAEAEIAHVNTNESEETENEEAVDIMYPDFMKSETNEVSGTDFGTLYHSIFELLDYNRAGSYDDIESQIDEMFNKGLIEAKMRPYVKVGAFYKFSKSNLAQRMKDADQKGNLWREQPFVLGVPAKMIYENASDDENVLVQGIIDAFFIEGDELVLVDYKTDRVGEDGENILICRYRKQMEYYKNALTRLFEKNVKECIIYSVSLNKEIIVDKELI